MPLNGESEALLALARAAGARPVEFLTIPQARASARQMIALQGEMLRLNKVDDRTLPLAHGACSARIYRPDAEDLLPLILYFHGGGWATGDVEIADRPCRELALRCRSMVVSLDYRLAPEHPYPAGLYDCIAAFEWVRDNVGALGAHPDKLVLCGDSAGGTLAAGVALDARDRGVTRPSALILIYPVVDFAFDSPSYAEYGNNLLLTRASMQWFWAHYLGPQSISKHDHILCPARASNLAGLPPTLIAIAECDPLRDHATNFAARLSESGVSVVSRHYDGQMHGFFWTLGATPSGRAVLDDIATMLDATFETPRLSSSEWIE